MVADDVARYYGAPRLCVEAFIPHPRLPLPSSAGCRGAVGGPRVTPREQGRGSELLVHGRGDSKDGNGLRDPPTVAQVLCSEHRKSLPVAEAPLGFNFMPGEHAELLAYRISVQHQPWLIHCSQPGNAGESGVNLTLPSTP